LKYLKITEKYRGNLPPLYCSKKECLFCKWSYGEIGPDLENLFCTNLNSNKKTCFEPSDKILLVKK
jgi:hypothetical protein